MAPLVLDPPAHGAGTVIGSSAYVYGWAGPPGVDDILCRYMLVKSMTLAQEPKQATRLLGSL